MRALTRPKANRDTRLWYRAIYTAIADARAYLDMKRGGRIVVVDLETFEEAVNENDSTIRLYAKAGDRLIVCGKAIDETCGVTVIAVETKDWTDKLLVHRYYGGEIADGEVWMLKAGRAT